MPFYSQKFPVVNGGQQSLYVFANGSFEHAGLRGLERSRHKAGVVGDHDHYAACDADVDWHIPWITSLLQSLPHLRAIYVRLDLVFPLCINTVTDRATLLATLPNLVDIKIGGSTSLESVGSADDSVLLATWTKQHGLQVDQEAIDLYIKRETDIVSLA